MTLVSTPAHGVEAQLSGVVHLYPSLEGDAVARRGVVLDIAAGEAVALLGATGTGKSTTRLDVCPPMTLRGERGSKCHRSPAMCAMASSARRP